MENKVADPFEGSFQKIEPTVIIPASEATLLRLASPEITIRFNKEQARQFMELAGIEPDPNSPAGPRLRRVVIED